MQKKKTGNAFSATIKDRNLSAGSVVSHKERKIHHFYYDIYCNSDDSERPSLVCKLPEVGCGCEEQRPVGDILPRVLWMLHLSGCPPATTIELAKQEIILNSHSLSPVIAKNCRAIFSLPDKQICPSSAS
jgi:hypothetical protein